MTSVGITFGNKVTLLGGIGTQGDFNLPGTDGRSEHREFDRATAVLSLPSDEILFLEGHRGRVGVFSKPYVNSDPAVLPYRIPTIWTDHLGNASDMIAYKDGILVSLPFAAKIVFVSKAGQVSDFAGTGEVGMTGDGGPATQAKFDNPQGLALDSKGNVYVADSNNYVIRRISPDGTITTVGGQLNHAAEKSVFTSGGKSLYYPKLIALDRNDSLYVYDGRNQIRRLTDQKEWEVIAGSGAYEFDGGDADATGTSLRLGKVSDFMFGPDGWLYYGDQTFHMIRRIDVGKPLIGQKAETVVGNGFTDRFPYYDDVPLNCTVADPLTFGFKPDGSLVYLEGSKFRWMTMAVGTKPAS